MKTKMRNHWQITYRGQLVHETTQPQRFLNSAAARDIELRVALHARPENRRKL